MITDRKHGDGPSYPIPLWNGIFDHRPKIGPALWVYLWCLDRITREESGVGFVLGGSVVHAERIAADLQDSDRTVRRHLKRLARHKYIGLKRDPYGFIITVAKSRKFNIWRADKNGHPERTKMPVRADKSAGQTANFVRSIKEDTAVDSAVDSASKHHACGALNLWLGTKDKLKLLIPPDEHRLWVPPARLLRVMNGNQMLIALPPNDRIIVAAKARENMLRDLLAEHGFGLSFTKYPDGHQMERLRTEYPEIYAQFFPAMREAHEKRAAS